MEGFRIRLRDFSQIQPTVPAQRNAIKETCKKDFFFKNLWKLEGEIVHRTVRTPTTT